MIKLLLFCTIWITLVNEFKLNISHEYVFYNFGLNKWLRRLNVEIYIYL